MWGLVLIPRESLMWKSTADVLRNDTRVNLRFDRGFGDNSSGNFAGVNEAL
jgi:hypothetical protein